MHAKLHPGPAFAPRHGGPVRGTARAGPVMSGPMQAGGMRCACGGGCPRCGQAAIPEPAPAPPIVTFEPQPESAGESGAGTGSSTTAAPPTPTRCQVKSFGLKIDPWNRAWPNGSGDYELRLPVRFSLELAGGVGRGDCLIGQLRKGQVEYGRYRRMGRVNIPMIDRILSADTTWKDDAPPGRRYWWDGAAWHAGAGSWGYRLFGNERASFNDEPGFASPSVLGAVLARGRVADGIGTHSFPIYWGGVGRKGHYRFRTFVADTATGALVRELSWGMLIDYPSPATGAHYFYK